jgi:hypothetical protein
MGEVDMGRSFLWVVGACAVLFSRPVAGAAYFESGNSLYRYCTGNLSQVELCLGYLEGVVDHLEADREYQKKAPCIHAGVEIGQVKDVVVKYLIDNPQLRDGPAWAMVVVAVTQAWGCN